MVEVVGIVLCIKCHTIYSDVNFFIKVLAGFYHNNIDNEKIFLIYINIKTIK